jgi:hypothetical protein
MMFRRRVIDSGLRYDPDIPMPCEDYALWSRAARQFQLANVPEVLLRYRVHPSQGGLVHKAKTASLTARIRREQLEWLGISPTPGEIATHQRLAESELVADIAFVQAARAWLEKLLAANQTTPRYDPDAFAKILAGRWAATCIYAAMAEPPKGGTTSVWELFWNSPLARFVDRFLEKNRPIPNQAGF